jgi:hypothetical protein
MLYLSHWRKINGKTNGARITLAGSGRWHNKKYYLNQDKKRFIISRLSEVLKAGEPSHFAFEGVCRTGIRRGLVLKGWSWNQADAMAAELVNKALNIIGAKRPTWLEGQLDWTLNSNAIAIKREACIVCKKPLPKGRTKFCSDRCHKSRLYKKQIEKVSSECMARQILEEAI